MASLHTDVDSPLVLPTLDKFQYRLAVCGDGHVCQRHYFHVAKYNSFRRYTLHVTPSFRGREDVLRYIGDLTSFLDGAG